MKMTYKHFNQSCIVLSLFFVIGTLYQWHGVEFSVQAREANPIDDEPYAALLEKDDLTPVSYSNRPKPDVGETQIIDPETDVQEAQGGPIDELQQLPDTIQLAVPFTSQAPEKNWDHPWQDACEEAAVLMLDAYYKDYGLSPLFAKDEILKMVAWEESQGWGGSIEISKIAQLAEDVTGKRARIISHPTAEDIRELLASGTPVLAVADGKALPNPHFSGDGPEYHALIIRGYTATTFITNDPGTQFGENFEYTYSDLLAALRDWNNGDVKNGVPVVLVLE